MLESFQLIYSRFRGTPKYSLLVLGLILFILPSNTYAQFWIQKVGGLTVEEGYAIDVDGAGNSYTTGYFTGTSLFGNTSLSSAGSTDIFVTKTDNNGNFLWAVRAGGTGSDRGIDIKTDSQGNSYITGFFNGTATFGSTSLTSSGNQDVFIAKYNSSGALQWAVRAGGTGADIGNGITLDNTNNIIVTGEFNGTATFGTSSLSTTSTASDAFTTKLSNSGTFIWTEQGTGSLSIRGIEVTSDPNDNVYVTGQFSGNVTFDVLHTNAMYNIIFLVKYNSQGQEQWFRVIGGGGSNIANGIASDNQSNIYLTGDFTGNLTFFGSSNYILSNAYSNKIFVAKYSTNGSLSWATASGSDGDLTSADIDVTPNGNSYIVGNYTCKLNEYADIYGQGTFNSVGYNDIYISSFNTSGVHQYSRNTGSRANDYGFGIGVNSSGYPHITGSYGQALNIPTSSNFIGTNLALWNSENCSGNSPYCSDNSYGNFHGLPNSGNLDIAILNFFDIARESYDYYTRNGSGCARPQGTVCFGTGCPDTLTGCQIVQASANSSTCGVVGPLYDFTWGHTSNQNPSLGISTSGIYYLTATSDDGCFTSNDSVFVNILPLPNKPNITDSKGINLNSTNPTPLELCTPDTVTLTAGNLTAANSYWTGPGLPTGGQSSNSIIASISGTYTIYTVDANGCSNETSINITFNPPLDPFLLRILANDTVTICEGNSVNLMLYDSIANPSASAICLNVGVPYNVTTTWNVTPFATTTSSCETYGFVFPDTTGYYHISATVVRENFCYTDTHEIDTNIYVIVNPTPDIPPFQDTILGSNFLCPGESGMLVGVGAPNYTWIGPGVNGLTTDTVYITQPGTYTVTSVLNVTNSYGCSNYHNSFDTITVFIKPQPTITSSHNLICPNDSIFLEVIGTGTDFYWEGPNGHIPGDSAIYATEAGQYYCIVDDSDSCGLVTNTILLTQYSTPQLLANGDIYLCDGDSVTISVSSNDSSLIVWQPPLSGNGLTQTVYSPGIYTCEITSCGIVTNASIEVLPSNPTANVFQSKQLCSHDSIVLSGEPGMNNYLWYPTGDTTDTIIVSDPGIYVLSIIDSTGCDAISDTIEISVIEIDTSLQLLGDSVLCSGDTLIVQAPSGYDEYLWAPGGETDSTLFIFSEGLYVLTITDTNGCFGVTSPIEVQIPDTITEIEAVGDLYFCEGDSVILEALTNDMAQYIWSPTNYEGQYYVVYEPGTYHLTTVDSFGCLAYSDSITVEVEPFDLTIPISSDTSICKGLPISLTATTQSGSIEWYDNIGGNLIQVGEQYNILSANNSITLYLRSVSELCASDYNPIQLEVLDCDNLFAPNVFTPNGDGVNDRLLFTIEEATCFNIKIFNRWGVLIYESENMNAGWDGTNQNNGEPVNAGTYYYIVDYCKYNGEKEAKTGYISLFRE